MTIAIYPGSFDPITYGHIDIIEKSANIFDEIIIAVTYNSNKKYLFTLEERVKLIRKAIANFPNVKVEFYEGLTVDFANKMNAKIMIRGIRNSLDFEYEAQLAQINTSLNNNIQTIFIPAKAENTIISSTMIKEIFLNNGDISKFTPNTVIEALHTKYGI